MSKHSKKRNAFALLISGAAHVAFALTLLSIPETAAKRYAIVDMAVYEAPKTPEIPPEPIASEVPPEPEAVPEKPAMKKAKRPEPKAIKTKETPPPPPKETPKPEAAPKEEAPPVFDLGDNTFAMGNGPGASWHLKRSEGNTRFAGVAKQNQPSVRGTRAPAPPKAKVKSSGIGSGNGNGYAPVPLKNLSRRPTPKNGPVSPPPYPLEAKKAGVEGPVVLKVFIDKKGKVRKTQVVEAPHNLLAKAAQIAMGNVVWTSPLDQRGNPVDTVIVWRFRFVLDG